MSSPGSGSNPRSPVSSTDQHRELPTAPPFACPQCGLPFDADGLDCSACDIQGRTYGGVVSFGPPREPDPADDWVERLAMEAERTDLASAIETVSRDGLERRDEAVASGGSVLRNEAVASDGATEANGTVPIDRDTLATEAFDVRREAWLGLVGSRVDGRCLVLNTGLGRRASTIASYADEVYGVDPSLSFARILAARTASRSRIDHITTHQTFANSVVPVHTNTSALPFATETFDTIVVDARGRSTGGVSKTLERLRPLLEKTGRLFCFVDGPTQRFAPSGDTRPHVRSTFRSVRPRTLSGHRRAVQQAGLTPVWTAALVPSADDPQFVFPVESDRAGALVVERVGLGSTTGGPWLVRRLASLAADGRLREFYPGFLLECAITDQERATGTDGGRSITNTTGSSGSNEGATPSDDWTTGAEDTVAIGGRARTVRLDVGADGPTRVRKIPNAPTHVLNTVRENAVLETLSVDGEIARSLPAGERIETPLGPGRSEATVTGRPLRETLDGSVDSFERVLDRGFDWLGRFHAQTLGKAIDRGPKSVRRDLSFEPGGIDPGPIDRSVSLRFGPVHGDFTPQNVFVTDDTISGVIDWEYSAETGNPVIDAGFFLLVVANLSFGGFEDGYDAISGADTAHSTVARSTVRRYCDRIEIPYRTFDRYLPVGYVHRLRLDWDAGAHSTRTGTMDRRCRAVKYVLENRASIAEERT